MKAIDIAQKLIEGCNLESTSDFQMWTFSGCSSDVVCGDTEFIMDYYATGYLQLNGGLTVWSCSNSDFMKIEQGLKDEIETLFASLFVWRFVELEAEEELEKVRMERAIADYRQMQDTYRTLQYQF